MPNIINLDNHFNITQLSPECIPYHNDIGQKIIKMLSWDNTINENKIINWYFIKYKKSNLNINNYHSTGLFRSVLTDGKKIIVYSPPKSYPINCITNEPYEHYILEELVEGTMINLFFNELKNDWDIATKSNVGGNYSFYQDEKITFNKMFYEAMNEQQIDINEFDKNICYSFVLQHPKNRIVVPFNEKRIILVAMYEIKDTIIKILNRNSCNIKNIIFPKPLDQYTDYNGSNWDDLQNYFNQMNIDYRITGVNIYNPNTGQRSKIRNPSYEYVRRLKGNSPKLQYQYYSLRRMGKVREFLKFYGEYRKIFSQLRKDLHDWTSQLYKNYIACYIKKEKPLLEFPKKFRVHMFNLHQIFINDLRELGHYISKQVVIKYVNSLEPAKLMYSVNYDFRKNKQEEIVQTAILSN
tara:strand:+ start:82 stop:1311 length:1230 start_codon:yes stop_codon:yes gene_type:complete